MLCKICGSKTQLVKTLTLRGKYSANYLRCENCKFMHVDNPTWLKEAYAVPINVTDTGYVSRNLFLARKTLILFSLLFNKNDLFLDYAGGYGMLTRLMRDYGLSYFNYDPFTANLFACGFEYKNQAVSAITCFECFEHLQNPIEEIEKILLISKNIFISTRLLPDRLPDDSWPYYGVEHGQHVSFYSKETFVYLAKKYSLYYHTDGDNLHFLTLKKIPFPILKIVNFLTKLQMDIFFRKRLKSKTTSDSEFIKHENIL